MAELQELVAEATAIRDTGNAQAFDALINDIKGRLISGETTGDEVLDYAILHKSSMDDGDLSGLRELKDRLVACPGEPFIAVASAERAYVSNPRTKDYILEIDTWGAVAVIDTLRLPRWFLVRRQLPRPANEVDGPNNRSFRRWQGNCMAGDQERSSPG